jgi:hypothetical protein
MINPDGDDGNHGRQVLLRVAAQSGGPVLLEKSYTVADLCRGSTYFASMLCGGFRESTLGVTTPVVVVLPLPWRAPLDLATVLDSVAGVDGPLTLDVALAYWTTLVYLGADACLADCVETCNESTNVWPVYRAHCSKCFARRRASWPLLFWWLSLDIKLMPDADLVLAIYARRIIDGDDNGTYSTRPRGVDKPTRLAHPSTTVFDRQRLWGLADLHPDPERECDGYYDCHEEADTMKWAAVLAQRHAEYGGALVCAFDQTTKRIVAIVDRGAPSSRTTCFDDVCIEGGQTRKSASMALASLALATALKDWADAIGPASPYTSRPYHLSMCDLLDRQWKDRLLVLPAVVDDSDRWPEVRQQTDDAVIKVTVDGRSRFEAALCSAFPHAADAVLPLLGVFRAADNGGTKGAGGTGSDDGAEAMVILAGGCVVEAIQHDSLRAHLDDSDIDVWIIGKSDVQRKAAFRHTVESLFASLPRHTATVRGSIVTFAIGTDASSSSDGVPSSSRQKVQVIYTDGVCGGDIISAFDLSHAAAYYDGTTVRATWSCAWSLVSRGTDALRDYGSPVRAVRVERARRKGFNPTLDVMALVRAQGDEDRAAIVCDQTTTTTTTTTKTAITERESARHTTTDTDALLALFEYRPIDAREYPDSDRPLLPPDQGPLGAVPLDEPIRLRMPPLRVAFKPMCWGCVSASVNRMHAPRYAHKCTCSTSVPITLDVPSAVDPEPEQSLVLLRHAADFCDRAKETDAEITRLAPSLVVGSRPAAHQPDGETPHTRISRREQQTPLIETYSNINTAKGVATRIRLDCSPRAGIINAITGTPIAGVDVGDRWVAGHIAISHIISFGYENCPRIVPSRLYAYPRALPGIVDGLDRASA